MSCTNDRRFVTVQGDLLPPLLAVLTLDGEPIDLSGVESVVFEGRYENTGVPITLAVTPHEDQSEEGGHRGEVTRELVAGETDLVGRAPGRFVVTYPGGKRMSAPKPHLFIFEVLARAA